MIRWLVALYGLSFYGLLGGVIGFFIGSMIENILYRLFFGNRNRSAHRSGDSYDDGRHYTYRGYDFHDFNAPPVQQSKSTYSYKILGIDMTATNEQIKKAYRNLVVKYHPDKYATQSPQVQHDAETKFIEIQNAYEIIKAERGL
ncbi:MAG: DnaJ domain-containing protein [Bacteroidales bacterium]|jgi:hypothetical protein|nr:DnaJ domain-containing protein [Bacteroidales bacterium]